MSSEVVEEWQALESNPSVLAEFAHRAGALNVKVYDIWSFDFQVLEPKTFAVILIYPHKALRKREKGKQPGSGDEVASLWYMTQTKDLPNACGAIALIHSLLNNTHQVELLEASALASFLKDTKPLSFEQRGHALSQHCSLKAIHNSLVPAGQSQVKASQDVEHHFVAFTAYNDHIVELDGAYYDSPKIVAPLPPGQSFSDVIGDVVKAVYFEPNPNVMDFGMMGVAITDA